MRLVHDTSRFFLQLIRLLALSPISVSSLIWQRQRASIFSAICARLSKTVWPISWWKCRVRHICAIAFLDWRMTSASSWTLRQITSDRMNIQPLLITYTTSCNCWSMRAKWSLMPKPSILTRFMLPQRPPLIQKASTCLPVLASDLNAMISILIFALIVRKLTLLSVVSL